MNPKAIAVTGHRPGRLPRWAPVFIRQYLENLVWLYPDSTWLTGGAIGADQIVAKKLLGLGQRVELVLPFPPDIQSAKWTQGQKQTLNDLVSRVSAVEIVSDFYNVSGYTKRNRRLISRAQRLVAFWNSNSLGGTSGTISIARNARVPVHIVYIDRQSGMPRNPLDSMEMEIADGLVDTSGESYSGNEETHARHRRQLPRSANA